MCNFQHYNAMLAQLMWCSALLTLCLLFIFYFLFFRLFFLILLTFDCLNLVIENRLNFKLNRFNQIFCLKKVKNTFFWLIIWISWIKISLKNSKASQFYSLQYFLIIRYFFGILIKRFFFVLKISFTQKSHIMTSMNW